jgi:undecaprenyl-diphosphatase
MKQHIHRFDQVMADWVGSMPRSLRLPMEFFTLIGQPPFTVGIAAAVLGYGVALSKDHYVFAGWIAIATLILSSILKLLLRRVRPRNDYVASMLFKTFSFPSGHAAGSIVSFGLAAVVLSLRWPEYSIAVWAIALIASFLVGVSRIYLGAHYASDVIGGWIIGALGLFIIVNSL